MNAKRIEIADVDGLLDLLAEAIVSQLDREFEHHVTVFHTDDRPGDSRLAPGLVLLARWRERAAWTVSKLR